MNKHRQGGLATVEFAIVGGAALMVLIGCIEMGRIFFVWNSLAESTRRAARLAAVCPVDSAAIKRTAMLSSNPNATSSTALAGLTTANLAVTYYDAAGAVTAVPANIRFVSVALTGYTYTLFIPFIAPTINAPPFRTTVPVESLGYVPETGASICMS